MESKVNAAVAILKQLGVYAALESTAVTIDQPKAEKKVKLKATPAQKKRIAGLRAEQKQLEERLDLLKKKSKGKIKTINQKPKKEFLQPLEKNIVLLKGTIASLRG